MAFGGAAVFSRKPFLNLRDIVFMYCMRPVPVVLMKEGRQVLAALFRAGIGASVSPLT